jgi:hypothetical protein
MSRTRLALLTLVHRHDLAPEQLIERARILEAWVDDAADKPEGPAVHSRRKRPVYKRTSRKAPLTSAEQTRRDDGAA